MLFLYQSAARIYATGKRCRIYQTSRIKKKRCYISHHCLTKGLKGTVGNQACPSLYGGTHEVNTTEPVKKITAFFSICVYGKVGYS